jgi:hypothetical protein
LKDIDLNDMESVVAKLQEAMRKNQGGNPKPVEKNKVAWSSDESSEDKPVTS